MSNKAINWAWTQTALSAAEMLVLVAISDAANNETNDCYLSQGRIADRCRMTRHTVNRHIQTLKAMSLLEMEYRYDEITGGRLSSIYRPTFIDPMAVNPDAKSKYGTRGKSKSDTRVMSNTDNTPVKKQPRQSQILAEAKSVDLTTITLYNPNNHNTNPPIVPPLQSKTDFVFAAIDAGQIEIMIAPLQISAPKQTPNKPKPECKTQRFAEFWNTWPPGYKKNKPGAERAWIKGNCDAYADEIVADIPIRQAHDRYWQGGYIPHPATYLNAKSWQDDITPNQVNADENRSKPMSAVDRAAAGAERLLERVRREAEGKKGGNVIEGVFDRVAGGNHW